MPDDVELRRTLSEPAARQLANATKTRAQMQAITEQTKELADAAVKSVVEATKPKT